MALEAPMDLETLVLAVEAMVWAEVAAVPAVPVAKASTEAVTARVEAAEAEVANTAEVEEADGVEGATLAVEMAREDSELVAVAVKVLEKVGAEREVATAEAMD